MSIFWRTWLDVKGDRFPQYNYSFPYALYNTVFKQQIKSVNLLFDVEVWRSYLGLIHRGFRAYQSVSQCQHRTKLYWQHKLGLFRAESSHKTCYNRNPPPIMTLDHFELLITPHPPPSPTEALHRNHNSTKYEFQLNVLFLLV